MSSNDCPCTSGKPYSECCAPFHKGLREAPDAVLLMRSRYAAFVLKDAEYLWRTLHKDHEDRREEKETILAAFRDAFAKNRYMGLRILDQRPADEHGVARVLFLANVFSQGKNISFVECSEFVNDGGWRYLAGDMIPITSVPGDPTLLTIATLPQVTVAH